MRRIVLYDREFDHQNPEQERKVIKEGWIHHWVDGHSLIALVEFDDGQSGNIHAARIGFVEPPKIILNKEKCSVRCVVCSKKLRIFGYLFDEFGNPLFEVQRCNCPE